MKSILTRIVTIVVLLTFLTTSAMAAWGTVSFDMKFQMDASGYPEEDQEILQGVADLLNMLKLTGTFQQNRTSFDLQLMLQLDNDSSTDTDFHVYGRHSHWIMKSKKLLGDEGVFLNLSAAPEFSVKAYNFLGLPLQYITFACMSYLWDYDLRFWNDAWETFKPEGYDEQTDCIQIDRDYVIEALTYIQDNAEIDYGFNSMVTALTIESGTQDYLWSNLASLADFADSYLDDDGILIERKDGVETWTAGGKKVFTRSADGWELKLPEFEEEPCKIQASSRIDNGEETLHFVISTREEGKLFDITYTRTIWNGKLPIIGAFNTKLDITGNMVDNEVHLRIEGEGSKEGYTFKQVRAEDGEPLLTVSGSWSKLKKKNQYYSFKEIAENVNLLSVNDNSLSELVSNVMDTFISGMLPLLSKMPYTSYQSIFALLQNYGILEVLTNGIEAE